VLRPKLLEKIANIGVGEDGRGKVHLCVLVKKLEQMIGNVRGHCGSFVRIPLGRKKEKLRIKRTWGGGSYGSQGRVMIFREQRPCVSVTVGPGA